MDPCASTGEKMTEPEIEALMAGQEDENGSVHYEGKLSFPSMPCLFLNIMPKISTYGFVFLQLSSSTSCLCKRPAVGVLRKL